MTNSIIWIMAVLTLSFKMRYILLKMRDGKLVYATKCGHRTKFSGNLVAFERSKVSVLPIRQDGTTAHCHRCQAEMTIRCAICGKPIFVGDRIMRYYPDKNKILPKHARRHSEEPGTYIACSRQTCFDPYSYRMERWVSPGKIYQASTAWRHHVPH